MQIIDKHGLLAEIRSRDNVILELGCGPRKKVQGAIGIDAIDYEGVDIVGDVYAILNCFPDNTVDELFSFHFLEHVQDLSKLVDEMARVLKPGGEIVSTVPHFSNPYFYSDYTHKQFFGLYSLSYLSIDNIFKRKVPNYTKQRRLELISADLVFFSPFHVRNKLKKFAGKIVNFRTWTKEFYEENLCHLLPCYEIRYHLRKIIS